MDIFHNAIKDLHSYILFKFFIISVNYLFTIIKLKKNHKSFHSKQILAFNKTY